MTLADVIRKTIKAQLKKKYKVQQGWFFGYFIPIAETDTFINECTNILARRIEKRGIQTLPLTTIIYNTLISREGRNKESKYELAELTEKAILEQ